MVSELNVVGVGPGDLDYIYPKARSIIESSDVLIGGRRNLELFKGLNKEVVVIENDLDCVDEYILANIKTKKITVLASGDPGVFSISEYLKNKNFPFKLNVYPGISSLQYLCAKLNKRWDDVAFVSLHGREEAQFEKILMKHRGIAVFTGGKSSPADVCKRLIEKGFDELIVSVGENLSYPEERIVTGTVYEVAELNFSGLSVMLIENMTNGVEVSEYKSEWISSPNIIDGLKNTNNLEVAECKREWGYASYGIPDEMFIRGDVPMTKQEVRSVSLSKLKLNIDSVVYDIGAGTGSVSVECALTAPKGRVLAIEKECDAADLIRRNADKFGVSDNVKIVIGEAPEVLVGLPVPDRIFIGGSGGNMGEIIEYISKIKGRLKIVANAVSPETVYEILEGFKSQAFEDIDVVCISVARGRALGYKHIMQALNPVYIVSAQKNESR